MMNKYYCLINKLVGSCRGSLLLWCCVLLWLNSFGTNADERADALATSKLLSGCQGTNLSEVKAYGENLNRFLDSAAADSLTQDFKYYPSIGSDPPDTVNGLFMCRGDVSSDKCANCVSTASTDFPNECSQMVGFVWYNHCLLRYSNQSFFSVLSIEEAYKVRNDKNVSSNEADKFNQVVESALNEVVDQAANDTRPNKKFAVGRANFSSSQNDSIIYMLAQCTPDLSNSDCKSCLTNAINIWVLKYCHNSRGCRVVYPSCMIRYELYPFYNASPPSRKGGVVIPGKKRLSKQATIAIAISTTFSVLLFVVLLVLLRRRSRKRPDAEVKDAYDDDKSLQIDLESLQYSLSEIRIATNDFSVDNKIGQGGFGHVYKGKLSDGQEIAVKRLSTRSGQGAQEFKNEIAVVAKLQHRNLVRLLGFCLEGGEKLLIYEFVPNKSLDYFLFDPEKQRLLDWSRRYRIIAGIARGLLYLHEDSRLRIVHRDLKTANILLDERMNPKIADFGMARICGVDEFEGNTNRIVGTFGYMAPEYTTAGQFSIKSDVFSFGVIVLEIVSGKKNSSFYQLDGTQDLLSYAWKNWKDGTPLALLDPTIGDSSARNEVIQSIHIGLLCVQEDVDQRPSIASVVLMLSSRSAIMPAPGQPAFFVRSKTESFPKGFQFDASTSNSIPASVNETTITELYPR